MTLTKYSLDILLTCIGGLILILVFAIISLLIYLDSAGPVILSHRRIGVDGSTFPATNSAQW